jgi:hypothetical protein
MKFSAVRVQINGNHKLSRKVMGCTATYDRLGIGLGIMVARAYFVPSGTFFLDATSTSSRDEHCPRSKKCRVEVVSFCFLCSPSPLKVATQYSTGIEARTFRG